MTRDSININFFNNNKELTSYKINNNECKKNSLELKL